MQYELFWLVMIIFLIIIEISTVNLVSIWFIASAIISLIISIFSDNFFFQFLSFVLFGIIFLMITKPIINKYLKERTKEKTNLERIFSMTGIVTGDIKQDEIGEVKIGGNHWSAISDERLKIGDKVTVKRIDGVKLVVSKKESDLKWHY